MMEDGELNFLTREMFSGSNLADWPRTDTNFNIDDIWKDTNAFYNVHAKLLVNDDDNSNNNSNDTVESIDTKKRPVGNREAVRKYREKKKARAASLEDEVVRLRMANQQLLKRVQRQGVLEAEISRLKCLLVDVRGRIEGEIGTFPYQKSANANVGSPGFGDCDLVEISCFGNRDSGVGNGNGGSNVNSSGVGKRRGGARAARAV